jgi:hypothetical protein
MAGISRLPNGKYRPRYRDEHGKERACHLDRKVDAQRWLDEVTAAMVTGTYVDPSAGRHNFAEYYAEWSARQVWAPGTEAAMSLAARSTTFANVQLRSLRRSHVEHWVKSMVTRGLAPGTVHTRANNVRAVLRGAVADRVIPGDPSEGVVLPRRPPFAPSSASAASPAFASAKRPPSVSATSTSSGARFRAPKYGSERHVYLAPSLIDLLAQHVATHCPDENWLLTGDSGQPPHQNTVGHRWRMTLAAAGLSGVKLHDLRHFYASGSSPPAAMSSPSSGPSGTPAPPRR